MAFVVETYIIPLEKFISALVVPAMGALEDWVPWKTGPTLGSLNAKKTGSVWIRSVLLYLHAGLPE